jgi:hypothetical protein
MRLGRLAPLLLLLVTSLVVTGQAGPASAEDPAPTALSLTGTSTYADQASTLRLLLADAAGTGLAAAPVAVERRVGGTWREFATLVTDDAGRAATDALLSKEPADNAFRATYAGDATTYAGSTSGPVAVPLVRRGSVLELGGPTSVVDEQSVPIEVTWRTGTGDPVAGEVAVYRRVGDSWRLDRRVRTGTDGIVRFSVAPRTDTRWQARAGRLAWVEGARSDTHVIDNRPPGTAVALPAGAPRPKLNPPAQGHAEGAGANVVITAVPDAVWNEMTGRTWHSGCPVGRASLRLVRLNYWAYNGYRRRGEFVAHVDAAGQIAAALADMYAAELPLRSLYRVDRWGYSRRVHGGDDLASMDAGNTSVFNCRDVVNRPGVRSPHSWGRALDLNTWENPYRSQQGIVPNVWWQSRSHPRVAWRSSAHRVVEIMADHGLRWTYGLGDTQHFDAPTGNGRYLRPVGCSGVCE